MDVERTAKDERVQDVIENFHRITLATLRSTRVTGLLDVLRLMEAMSALTFSSGPQPGRGWRPAAARFRSSLQG